MSVSGYGPIAGPLVITAVAMHPQSVTACRDSKAYSNFLTMAADVAASKWMCHAVISISPNDLMALGYSGAMKKGYHLAIESVRRHIRPLCPRAVIDGSTTWYARHVVTKVQADKTEPAVSLASCIGKLNQVTCMRQADIRWPEYGFQKHHGYGTSQHIAAIIKYGAIPGFHRIPVVAAMLKKQNITLTTRSL